MVHHRPKAENQKEEVSSGIRFEDVCKPGNTLLWDLVQDHKIVSVLYLLCVCRL